MDTYSNNPSLKTREDFDSDEEYQEYIDYVNGFLNRLEDLLDDIVDEE